MKQAETQRQASDNTVSARLPETYQWLLVPVQRSPQDAIQWEAVRLVGTESLASRAGRRLKRDELLVSTLGGTILRKHMDDVPLWRGDSVPVRQLVEDFARYLYLPRLQGPEVLAQAARDGLALLTWRKDSFGFAESYDEESNRYRGLRGGRSMELSPESPGLLVRPDVAGAQLEREVAPVGGTMAKPPDDSSEPPTTGAEPDRVAPPPEVSSGPHRFHGTVLLDPARVGRDAGQIAEEVVSHLFGLLGSRVTVTLEIDAEIAEGAPDHVVRTVTENCRTLKFQSQGFEDE